MSHFDYGDVVFHTANVDKSSPFVFESNNILEKKIESIQYEAARILTGAWKGSSIKKTIHQSWQGIVE